MALSTTIQCRVSRAFKARLDAFAASQGMSVTAVMQAAILEYIERHARKKPARRSEPADA